MCLHSDFIIVCWAMGIFNVFFSLHSSLGENAHYSVNSVAHREPLTLALNRGVRSVDSNTKEDNFF